MAGRTMTKTNRPSRRRFTFRWEDEPGKIVAVAGSFNDWQPDKPLIDRDGNGVYTAVLMLEPGYYEYKFVINGEWQLDKNNPKFKPNDIGSLNSVLIVEAK